MKRSDFLAFLPAISTLPFIGTDIVKSDKGIFIANPKIIEPSQGFKFSDFDLRNMTLELKSNGQPIGSAVCTRIDWNTDMIEYGSGRLPGRQRCTLQAEVIEGLLVKR